MSNSEQVLNSEKSLDMAEVVSRTIKTIALQNHMIDFADNPNEKMTADDVLVKYMYLTRALSDIFDLNQSLMNDLDKAAAYLYGITEEQKEAEKNENV